MSELYELLISWTVPLGVIALLYCISAQFGVRLIELVLLAHVGCPILAMFASELGAPFISTPTSDFLVHLWVWAWSIGGLICGMLLFRQRFRQLRRAP
ncbi:MAG: hypothetical protein AAF585_16345 [Verrucomicrobiota bacterium]